MWSMILTGIGFAWGVIRYAIVMQSNFPKMSRIKVVFVIPITVFWFIVISIATLFYLMGKVWI